MAVYYGTRMDMTQKHGAIDPVMTGHASVRDAAFLVMAVGRGSYPAQAFETLEAARTYAHEQARKAEVGAFECKPRMSYLNVGVTLSRAA